MEELINDVCTMYEWTHSVNETAGKMGLSTGKVRKILITEGYDMGNTATKVKAMSEERMSASEIAAALKISEKTVSAYVPYSKGVYNASHKSASATRSARYRAKRSMLEFSDRVLNPGGDYGFIAPSSRDVLVYGGFFQFNLSKLIGLTESMSAVSMPVSGLSLWADEEQEFFDEPPIVLEFNPTVAYARDFTVESCIEFPQRYTLLNCHRQVLDAKARGDETMEVYVFNMERYVPYITLHFREFARYWNEKLSGLLGIYPVL